MGKRGRSSQKQAMNFPLKRSFFLFVLICLFFLAFVTRTLDLEDHQDASTNRETVIKPEIHDLVNFQAHSLNDLRTWHSMLQKGMDWIKIDFFYVPENYSHDQLLLRKDFANQYPGFKLDFLDFHSDIDLSRFLLTHDRPYDAQFYFNSKDVLNYIVHPNYIHYFNNTQKRIYIALCFKLAFNPCIATADSQAWIQAVDEFYERANIAIYQYNLNVEFILDQSGTPGGRGMQNRNCLAHKWPGWVSTYISYRDPPEAFLSNEDTTYTYTGNNMARFQILNEAIPGPATGFNTTFFIETAAKQQYGKFLNGNYPIVVWEPSNQHEIQQVMKVFFNYSLANQHGFRFSINNDVPQFQIFANLTNRAWNLHLPELAQHHNPHVITLPSKSGNSILVFSSGIDGNVCHVIYTTKILSKHLEIKHKYLLREVTTKIKSVNTFSVEDSNMMVIQDEFGTFYFYLYHENSMKFQRTVQRSADNTGTWKFHQSSLVHKDDKLFLAQLVSSATCHLELELLQIQIKLPKIELNLKSQHCLGSFKGKDYTVEDAAVLLFDDHHKGLQGLVFFTALNRDFYATFASTIQLNRDKGDLYSVSKPAPSTSLEESFVWISGGEAIHASVAKHKDSYVIALVNDRGVCWYSILNNLKASPLLCDNFPDSVPTILNYAYGTLQQWFEFLNTSQKIEFGEDQLYQNVLTPCASLHDDSVLFHGVFDRGYSPKGSLVFSDDQASIVTVHRGLDRETASIDYMSCGEAVPYAGVVLDAWKLPDVFQPAPQVKTESAKGWSRFEMWIAIVGFLVATFLFTAWITPKTIKPQ